MTIEVREMQEGDCLPIARIIRDTWSMGEYGEGIGIPLSLGFLYRCLDGSTFRRTAVVDGVVVGCVVARSGGPSDAPDVDP